MPNGTTPNLADIALRWMVRECFKTHNGMTFDPTRLAKIGLAPDSLYPTVTPRPAAVEPAPEQRVSTENILKPGMVQRASAWVTSWFPSSPAARVAPDTGANDTYYSEEQRDLADALAPLYDQLVINRAKWWALENVWLQMWSVTKKTFERRRNQGRGRTILPPVDAALTDSATATARGLVPLNARWAKVRVHRTVQARMACAGDGKTPPYVPKALLNGLTLDKVDPALIEWVD